MTILVELTGIEPMTSFTPVRGLAAMLSDQQPISAAAKLIVTDSRGRTNMIAPVDPTPTLEASRRLHCPRHLVCR
jgi:hypothetical protein